MSGAFRIMTGDCIERMRGLLDQSVNTCVTSPPYFGLRDYQVEGQIGLEATPEAYVARLVDVFREVGHEFDTGLWAQHARRVQDVRAGA